MTEINKRFSDVDQLRRFVLQSLCQQNDLEVGVFPLSERLLKRRETVVGIQFCLHGPRKVRFIAIWETDKHSILFYGSTGERIGRIGLKTNIGLEKQLQNVAA